MSTNSQVIERSATPVVEAKLDIDDRLVDAVAAHMDGYVAPFGSSEEDEAFAMRDLLLRELPLEQLHYLATIGWSLINLANRRGSAVSKG